MRHTPWSTSFLVFLLLALPLSAGAESEGERIIRIMDETLSRAKDQSFIFDIVTREPGKANKEMAMQVRIKGRSWRRVDFLSPGDIKGMKVLIVSVSQMYVYLPAYRKVRRVASHARSQSFMGTALSQDDMSLTTFGELFSGKLISQTPSQWKVEGTLRPGKTFPYAKILLTILKKEQHPSEIIYYSARGVKLKTETRTGYECHREICNPKVIKMVDHTRNGLWTELTRREWQMNSGLPDALFTPRKLQQSR